MPHIHDKIDYAADAYIVNDGAVLLRMHEKYNRWFPPGGHVELDEDPAEAAIREAKEETGLDITFIGDTPHAVSKDEWEILPPRFVNRHRISETHEHVAFEYFATSQSRDLAPAPGEKTDGFKWFTEAELDDPAYGVEERVKHYAKEALKAATK